MDLALFDDASEESDFEYRDLAIVCRHLLRRQQLFEQLGPIAHEIGYFNKYRVLQTLFEAQWRYGEVYHMGLITRDWLVQELKASRISQSLDETDFNEAMALVNTWWEETEFSDDVIVDMLRSARLEYIDRDVRDRQEDGDNILEIIQDAKQALDIDPFSRAVEASLFTNPEKFLASIECYPCGVNFFDEALDGGGQAGDLIGVLAPSGGGKTTLAIQMCAAQVEKKRHVIYFQTEQDIEGDIAQRSFVQATKMEKRHWKGGWAKASMEARKQFMRVHKQWDKYYHPFSLRDCMPTSIDELFSYVEEVRRKNPDLADEEPIYVILDWWGDIRDALMEHLTGSKSEAAARRASRTWLKQVKAKGAPVHCNCINMIFHQLSGEAASKSPERVQSSHNAQEDRNFNNRMDFCFTFSVLDSNNRTKVFSDKARRNRKQQCLVQLVGELCMFKQAKDPDSSTETLTEIIDDDMNFEDSPEDVTNGEAAADIYETGLDDDDITDGFD